jgi:hypothetical protein
VKVVQELLRQASVLITLDTYAQAKMQDKRRAQLRVVEEIRPHPGKAVQRGDGELAPDWPQDFWENRAKAI